MPSKQPKKQQYSNENWTEKDVYGFSVQFLKIILFDDFYNDAMVGFSQMTLR